MSVGTKTDLIECQSFRRRESARSGTVVTDGWSDLDWTDATGTEVVDCGGAILLPGLIDDHIHLAGIDDLENLASWTWWPGHSSYWRLWEEERESPIFEAAATSPGSTHSHIVPKECTLSGLRKKGICCKEGGRGIILHQDHCRHSSTRSKRQLIVWHPKPNDTGSYLLLMPQVSDPSKWRKLPK